MPSVAKELEIVPEFSYHNLTKFRSTAKIFYNRMSEFYAPEFIIETLLTKLKEPDFILASEQQIDTWEKFENLINLLARSGKNAAALLQEIMNLRQFHRESLIDYLHRVELLAADYKLSVKVKNEIPMFTDTAFNSFVSKLGAKGLKPVYRMKFTDQLNTMTMNDLRTFCYNPTNEVYAHLNEKSFLVPSDDSE